MRTAVTSLLLFMMVHVSCAQESVWDVWKSHARLAQEYFNNGDLPRAIAMYNRAPVGKRNQKMLGRSYFRMKEYMLCVDAYDRYDATQPSWEERDLIYYAEALLSLRKWDRAFKVYQKYQMTQSEQDWIMQKLWRISNMKYLWEDSIHIAVRALSVNTEAAEWAGTPVNDGLLFLSDRGSNTPIKQVDASTLQPFFRFFVAHEKRDTLLDGWGMLFTKPGVSDHSKLAPDGNLGSFMLYDNQTRMVFTATMDQKDRLGRRNLGLFFAERIAENWKVTAAFEHNGVSFSTCDPFLDEKAHVLYFSSDRPGGEGGNDIYQSVWINNKWSNPQNLGKSMNTPLEETHPRMFGNSLFFSSTGLAGIGGSDIYRVDKFGNGFTEPVNMGYPINTSWDDFGIFFTDSLTTHGFLSSNRKRGGLDDDLYEFDMDMQSYPLTLTGVIKQKDHSWSDSSATQVLANSQILVIDNIRQVKVHESVSDERGNFSITLPYFSKYTIHVRDAAGIESIAVLNVPRQKKESTIHEIVLVKDIFQTITD
jgi:tetratricopeptide (TPR) repeat protein